MMTNYLVIKEEYEDTEESLVNDVNDNMPAVLLERSGTDILVKICKS